MYMKKGEIVSKVFYRFRSIHNLLEGHEELVKQSIYFANPKELNDPMEGHRDFFWSGDEIVWKNLFKHYLFCLEHLTAGLLIADKNFVLSSADIPVFGDIEDLPTEKYKNTIIKIQTRFFELENISIFLKNILKRSTPIRQGELHFYLSSIHMAAFKVILDVYIEEGLSPASNRLSSNCYSQIDKIISGKFIELLERSLHENQMEEKVIYNFFFTQQKLQEEIKLINKHRGIIGNDNPSKEFVINEFPRSYINRLIELIIPSWYTACFMEECENSSIWGTYGVNHSGACLVFNCEVIDNAYFLKLNGITGWGSNGAIYGERAHFFNSINYQKGFNEIDFFRSIGSLPVPTLDRMWYVDEEEKLSVCAEEMKKSIDKWRKKFWSNFIRDITVKSMDWKYEAESRLILHSSITDLSKKEDRTLTYNFSSLKGIIFGINTSEKDKLRIIQIIEEKCCKNKREDFNFYQAYFSFDEHCIKHAEMDLLNFN